MNLNEANYIMLECVSQVEIFTKKGIYKHFMLILNRKAMSIILHKHIEILPIKSNSSPDLLIQTINKITRGSSYILQ